MSGSALRRPLLACAASLALLALLEGLASVGYAVLDASSVEPVPEEAHCEYDPDLGWRNRPNARIDLDDAGSRYTTNSQGFRTTGGDYEAAVPAGRYRIICLGDSYTMGYGVGDAETYPAQMEQLGAGLEVVNMGLGGYGADQSYLWYRRDAAGLEADLVVFAFIKHDFDRTTSGTFNGFQKPFFQVEGGELVLRNVPVPRNWESRTTWERVEQIPDNLALGRAVHAVLKRMVGTPEPREYGPQVFGDVGALIFRELRDLCRERGQHLVAVYLPVLEVIDKEPRVEAIWAEEAARGLGIPFLNLTPEFQSLRQPEFQACLGLEAHYSAAGNRLVAQLLLGRLREMFDDMP